MNKKALLIGAIIVAVVALIIVLVKKKTAPLIPSALKILKDYHSEYVKFMEANPCDPESDDFKEQSWAYRSKIYGAISNYGITKASLLQNGREIKLSLEGTYILNANLPHAEDYPPTIYIAIRCYEKNLFDLYGKPDFTLPSCGLYETAQPGQPIPGINAFAFGGTGIWKPAQPEGFGISGTVSFVPAEGQFDEVIWHVPYAYQHQAFVNVCNLNQVVLPPGTYVVTVLVGIQVTERGGQWLIPEYYYQWKEITVSALEPQYIPYDEYIAHLGDSEYWNEMWFKYCGRSVE